MKPTQRQLEALRLRSSGMTYQEIAKAMGISGQTANCLARAAARRLIVTKGPSEEDRQKAFQHFPKLVAKYGKAGT